MCRMHESSCCPIPSPAKLARVKIVQVLSSVYYDAQSNVCKARYNRLLRSMSFLWALMDQGALMATTRDYDSSSDQVLGASRYMYSTITPNSDM